MEEPAVGHRDSDAFETHAKCHVIWGIVGVALTFLRQEVSGATAEHHSEKEDSLFDASSSHVNSALNESIFVLSYDTFHPPHAL